MPIRETQKLPGLKAYPVNKRELRQAEVGWEWLYGKLSKGQYRIIKNNLDVRSVGDYTVHYLSVEFVMEWKLGYISKI